MHHFVVHYLDEKRQKIALNETMPFNVYLLRGTLHWEVFSRFC